MSEVVNKIGFLTEIQTIDDLENTARILLQLDGAEREPIHYDTCLDQLLEDLEDSYTLHNNKLYRVTINSTKDFHVDTFESIKGENGIIKFRLKYHNGGCSFKEALEYALNTPSTPNISYSDMEI